MKKVILSAAVACLALSANAQSTQFRSADNDITVGLSMMLPNWIDLDPEAQSLSTALPTSGDWTTLENGWTVGTANLTISATRHCQIDAWADDVRRADHSSSNDAHYYFNSTFLSTITDIGSGINDEAFLAVAQTSLADNNSGALPILTSSEGGHDVTFTVQVNAFKNAGNGGIATNESYYEQNLHGSETNAYTSTLHLNAYLTGN